MNTFDLRSHFTELAANFSSARKPIRWRLWLAALVLPLVGCAHITFHNPADPQRNVGVEYYKPKLFLLVTATGAGAYKADILTLPDLSQPRYALLHPGYGANNLSLKMNNGILTDVGQQTDTQIPQTISALGSLATAAAGVAKGLPPPPSSGEPFRLYEILYREGRFEFRRIQLPSGG